MTCRTKIFTAGELGKSYPVNTTNADGSRKLFIDSLQVLDVAVKNRGETRARRLDSHAKTSKSCRPPVSQPAIYF